MYVYIYIYIDTHVATKQINTDTHTDIPRRRCFFALWPCRSCSCTADFPRCSFGCGSCRSTDCCHRFGCRVILSGSRQWVQSIPSIPASHEGPAPAEKMWLVGQIWGGKYLTVGDVEWCGTRRKWCRQWEKRVGRRIFYVTFTSKTKPPFNSATSGGLKKGTPVQSSNFAGILLVTCIFGSNADARDRVCR